MLIGPDTKFTRKERVLANMPDTKFNRMLSVLADRAVHYIY